MSPRPVQRLGVVGGGAWGTALALAARRAGRDVVLWAREPEVVADIAANRRNERFLPGATIDPAIRPTGDLAVAADADAVLLVSPAQALRAVTTALAPHLARDTPLVVCAKGVEDKTGLLMPAVAAAAAPGRPVAMLSGPTFAEEVANGMPTAVTIAAEDLGLAESLAAALGSATFRPYAADDPTGAALGGAVKNVIAVACGVVAGRKLGSNARAALITRGFAEMVRLGRALGARLETMAGLAGYGDLVLTCTSTQSRNYSLGVAVGEGARAAEFLAGRASVAEGYASAPAVCALARRMGVAMPICEATRAVLHDGADVGDTIRALLARPLAIEAV